MSSFATQNCLSSSCGKCEGGQQAHLIVLFMFWSKRPKITMNNAIVHHHLHDLEQALKDENAVVHRCVVFCKCERG